MEGGSSEKLGEAGREEKSHRDGVQRNLESSHLCHCRQRTQRGWTCSESDCWACGMGAAEGGGGGVSGDRRCCGGCSLCLSLRPSGGTELAGGGVQREGFEVGGIRAHGSRD